MLSRSLWLISVNPHRIGILPCWCLGSDGRNPWRTFEQDHQLDARIHAWLLEPQTIQEDTRTKVYTPTPPPLPLMISDEERKKFSHFSILSQISLDRSPTKPEKLPEIAYMAMVEDVDSRKAIAQCCQPRRRLTGKMLLIYHALAPTRLFIKPHFYRFIAFYNSYPYYL